MSLLCCPTCKRHARRTEERCPFCGVELPSELRRSKRAAAPPQGLSRARLYAMHAVIATGVAVSCGGTTTPDDGGVTDAVADTSKDASTDGLTFADVSTDVTQKDVVQDAQDEIIIPPPPYGCVFPEGCGDVKV